MNKNNIYIVLDKVILEKLVAEGTLSRSMNKYGDYIYTYPNSNGWVAVNSYDGSLLRYDKEFFDIAYITDDDELDSNTDAGCLIARSMTTDEIIEHIRKTSKKFCDTFTALKNREIMNALDALS